LKFDALIVAVDVEYLKNFDVAVVRDNYYPSFLDPLVIYIPFALNVDHVVVASLMLKDIPFVFVDDDGVVKEVVVVVVSVVAFVVDVHDAVVVVVQFQCILVDRLMEDYTFVDVVAVVLKTAEDSVVMDQYYNYYLVVKLLMYACKGYLDLLKDNFVVDYNVLLNMEMVEAQKGGYLYDDILQMIVDQKSLKLVEGSFLVVGFEVVVAAVVVVDSIHYLHHEIVEVDLDRMIAFVLFLFSAFK
jgi:hypothetical protein